MLIFDGYDIEQANIQSAGSKKRRSECGLEGLPPNFTFFNAGMAVLSLECKHPIIVGAVQSIIDKWKLANLREDEADWLTGNSS